MSIRIMQAVFERSKSKGAARLVALALADHADQDGRCWPSWARIAEYANLSRRAVAEAVKTLEEIGEISVASGAGKHRTNMYFFTEALSGEGANGAPCQTRNSANGAPLKVQTAHLEGANGAPGTVIEPSGEPSKNTRDNARASFPGTHYEAVENAFSAAYRDKTRQPHSWTLPGRSISAGRAALRDLFASGRTPDELAALALRYVAEIADGRYRRYTVAAFCAAVPDMEAGIVTDKAERRALAAYDADWRDR